MVLVPANSFIHTDVGLIKSSLLCNHDSVLGSKGYTKILSVKRTEKKNIVRISTNDGYLDIESNQVIYVLKSHNEVVGIPVKELAEGDTITTARVPLNGDIPRVKSFDGKYFDMNALVAYFLSVFLLKGDIYLLHNGVVNFKFSPNEACIMEQIKKTVRYFGDFVFCVVEKEMSGVKVQSLSIVNKKFAQYLITNFINIKNPTIPDTIYKALVNIRIAYICGLISQDKNDDNTYIIAPTSSFLYDIQSLLYSCGIESRQCIDKNGYRLKITTKYSHHILRTSSVFPHSLCYEANISESNIYPKELFDGQETRDMKINEYEQIYGISKYVPVQVTKIEQLDKLECYEITAEKAEFNIYCNGYLI